MDSVVVMGGGLGAAHTCDQLRHQGFSGTLTLLSDEEHAPYDRPPLSKADSTEEAGPPSLPVDWLKLAVNVRLRRAVRELRRESDGWSVGTDDGSVTADAVVIATGAQPRRLPDMDRHEHALTLRTWADAVRVRSRLTPGARVVVVGAGWIGSEVAALAARRGCRVTVVDGADTPLPVLTAGAPDLAGAVRSWFASEQVELRLGVGVAGFARRGVTLTDGSTLVADVVVVGVGVRPSTRPLEGVVDLDGEGAVLVDEHLRASAPGLFAIGDCASYRSLRYGRQLRPEHWTNAQQGASSVAASLVGALAIHDPVPYFWSHQFGRMVQYCGWHEPDHELVLRDDPLGDCWSALWIDPAGEVSAALAVRDPKAFAQLRRSIELGGAAVPSR